MTVQISVRQSSLVKKTKQILEKFKLLSRNHKIQRQDDGSFVLTTSIDDLGQIPQVIKDMSGIKFVEVDLQDLSGDNCKRNLIEMFVWNKLSELQIDKDIISVLIDKLPKKWTVYSPLLLINNQDTFESSEWTNFFKDDQKIDRALFFKEMLASVFGQGITNIAINKPIIEQDIMRRPFALLPIYGDFGPEPTSSMFDDPTNDDFDEALWCNVIQNGIHQSWAPRYTMFSRGNIKEKKRILDTFSNVNGNCVVDLYAGIGYFTLSYLKLGARHMFCFELNPWSIQGLVRGVKANGYTYKVIRHDDVFVYDDSVQVFIFHESNEFAESRLKQIELPITHINLGLLPSSKPSWSIAESLFLNHSTSSVCEIHIHENVHVDDLPDFMDSTSSELLQISPVENLMVEPLKLEKIKTFAPDVWHICADFKLIK